MAKEWGTSLKTVASIPPGPPPLVPASGPTTREVFTENKWRLCLCPTSQVGRCIFRNGLSLPLQSHPKPPVADVSLRGRKESTIHAGLCKPVEQHRACRLFPSRPPGTAPSLEGETRAWGDGWSLRATNLLNRVQPRKCLLKFLAASFRRRLGASHLAVSTVTEFTRQLVHDLNPGSAYPSYGSTRHSGFPPRCRRHCWGSGDPQMAPVVPSPGGTMV